MSFGIHPLFSFRAELFRFPSGHNSLVVDLRLVQKGGSGDVLWHPHTPCSVDVGTDRIIRGSSTS